MCYLDNAGVTLLNKVSELQQARAPGVSLLNPWIERRSTNVINPGKLGALIPMPID